MAEGGRDGLRGSESRLGRQRGRPQDEGSGRRRPAGEAGAGGCRRWSGRRGGPRSGPAGLVRLRREGLVTAGLAGVKSLDGFQNWLLFAIEVSLAATRGLVERMGDAGRRGSGKGVDWGRVWGLTGGKNDLMCGRDSGCEKSPGWAPRCLASAARWTGALFTERVAGG